MTPLHTIFLDLDDTLYPRDNGVWRAISARINRYMVDRVGLSRAEAREARRRYFRRFGTSLTGLMVEHDISAEEYLEYVHDIPLRDYLAERPELLTILQDLPQSKYVFSNASEAHVRRVLDALGVDAAIDGVIGIESLDLVSKPDLRAYSRALDLAGGPEPAACLLVDDQPRNLRTAQQLGMLTALVDSRSEEIAGPDYHLRSILDLPAAVADLSTGDERPD